MIRLTIERLRAVVLAGTLLLVAVLGGVLLYAHYRARALLADLPSRLGLDVQKQTNGLTVSKTLKGRTVFTVHAAKATQRKNGQTDLEDAGVVLYGDGDGRADRIYGKSFHYDQAAGVVTALGVVQLDLHAPAPVSAEDRSRFASGAEMRQSAGARGGTGSEEPPVHVVTSGLVYSQKSGMATTAAPVHFEYEGVTGDARGASYNSRTGYTTFESDIRVHGIQNGRAFAMTAAHGEFDRAADRLVLRSATMDNEQLGENAEQLRASVLVVHLVAGGGADRVEGSGGVEVAEGGGTARSPTAELTLGAGNRPERVRMWGGVEFAHVAQEPGGERVSGTAADGVGQFDRAGALGSVVLTRAVVEAVAEKDGAERELRGSEVLLALAGVPGGTRRWVRQVTATGQAEVHAVQRGAKAGEDSLAADRLVGRLVLEEGAGGSVRLDGVMGRGNVVLRRSAAGLEETSRAETMEGSFAAVAGGKGGSGPRGTGPLALRTVVEGGGVVIDRSSRRPDGTAETMHATTQEASYDGVTQMATLNGDAVLTQAADTVRADRIVLAEATGDAEAFGRVRATLSQEVAGGAAAKGPREPVDAVATHARFAHGTEAVTLLGEGGAMARLWQGASQVEAPVIAVRKRDGLLDATGRPGAPVRTVMAEEPAKDAGKTPVTRVARVESESLHYSDAKRRAEFLGSVVLRSVEGVIEAKRMEATIAARAGSGTAAGSGGREKTIDAAAGMLGGSLERVVADGGVRLEQPGRVATGEQLVYTATDEMFVLTGTPQVPPVVMDQVNGSVTGAVLRFHSGDDSVAIEGGTSKGKQGRVHTEIRMNQ